jgi:hypothetical protein
MASENRTVTGILINHRVLVDSVGVGFCRLGAVVAGRNRQTSDPADC